GLGPPRFAMGRERKWISGENDSLIHLNRACPTVPEKRVVSSPHPGAAHDSRERQQKRNAPAAPRSGESAHRSAESAHDLDSCGTQKNDEKRRENAEHEREYQLHRSCEGLLLGSLAALDSHLVGLDPQHPSDGDTERLRLEHGQEE